MFTSEALTNGIRVRVASTFDPIRSRVAENLWFFLYTITIANEGDCRVQLLSRHWIITDESGRVEEVRGAGVVGEQPSLEPGEAFEYTSGCPLPTPTGTMRGTYSMCTAEGATFEVEIAPFLLSEPYLVN